MGVPALFRWLSQKYPSIVVHCREQKRIHDQEQIDSTQPNPNEVEFDNLYLDMNGIIHPCTHPENKPAPANEAEMFYEIFLYIDRLFAIVRPRRLLYFAVDGVAPRAKMNQQRSRRFRAGLERRETAQTMARLREELLAKGVRLPDASENAMSKFDSNCITPGTPFMSRLSFALQFYIYDRMSKDPAWAPLQVILSDASVPGEGEHKIMDFIRRQRVRPEHDPNTRHCLCGADADLIMLGLASHEPHFTIIREEYKHNQPKPCVLCGRMGHEMTQCTGLDGAPGKNDKASGSGKTNKLFFVRLDVLRKKLDKEFRNFETNANKNRISPVNINKKKIKDDGLEYDFERTLDDWVFMCFFVGNDFLPHLPSLEIHEQAIDRLFDIYQSSVRREGGWLTDSGRVHIDSVLQMMRELAKVEANIFKERRDSDIKNRSRNKRKRQSMMVQSSKSSSNLIRRRTSMPEVLSETLEESNERQKANVFKLRRASEMRYRSRNKRKLENMAVQPFRSSSNAKRWPKSMPEVLSGAIEDSHEGRHAGGGEGVERKSSFSKLGTSRFSKLPDTNAQLSEDQNKTDQVKLWEDGFRERYYLSKFGVDVEASDPSSVGFPQRVAQEYLRGLCWVLAYYYQGCCSWNWFYPYHYAPFAADFAGCYHAAAGEEDDEMNFRHNAEEAAHQFRPLEQLMAVFPADSKDHVPPGWAPLMCNAATSNIIDFYPTSFRIDLNGKKFAWQGVALLPFIDETRLLSALAKKSDALTESERRRNIIGQNWMFVHRKHRLAKHIQHLYRNATDETVETEEKNDEELFELDTKRTGGVSGTICALRNKVANCEQFYLPNQSVPSPAPDFCGNVTDNAAFVCAYKDPMPEAVDFVFPAKLLDGVTLPANTLTSDELQYRASGGAAGRGGGRGRGGGGSMNRPSFSASSSSSSTPSGSFGSSNSFPGQRPNRPVIGMGAQGGYRPLNSAYNPQIAQRMLRHSLHQPRGSPHPPPSRHFQHQNSNNSPYRQFFNHSFGQNDCPAPSFLYGQEAPQSNYNNYQQQQQYQQPPAFQHPPPQHQRFQSRNSNSYHPPLHHRHPNSHHRY